MQVYNPFLPLDEYIPDGEPHVFGDRVYLFGSHDKERGETFCMLPYAVWSAPVNDLRNWSCSGVIFDPKQDPRYDAEKAMHAYAPDVVKGNDGKFYLYYCLAGYRGVGGYSQPISVAVCDKPDGRYEYLGTVKNPDGSTFMKYVNFDPAVINDDGVIRLYSGTWYGFEEPSQTRARGDILAQESEMFGKDMNHIEELWKANDSVFGPFHMTLADDMMTLTSEPVRVLPLVHEGTPFADHGFFEGSSIRKIKDTYYFIYSSVNNHELCYATSKKPDRDFVYGGTIVSNGDIGYEGRHPEDRLNATGTTHGGIEQINGQWYVFYHRLTHKTDYSRQACAEPITIADDGSIAQVEMTSCGLNGAPLLGCGEYPAPVCCNLTNGKMPHGTNVSLDVDIPCVSSEGDERYVHDVANGTWVGYKYFDFGEGASSVTLTVRGTGHGEWKIYTKMDAPKSVGTLASAVPETSANPPVGTATAEPSEAWSEVRIETAGLKGISPLYINYNGDGKFDIKLIKIEK